MIGWLIRWLINWLLYRSWVSYRQYVQTWIYDMMIWLHAWSDPLIKKKHIVKVDTSIHPPCIFPMCPWICHLYNVINILFFLVFGFYLDRYSLWICVLYWYFILIDWCFKIIIAIQTVIFFHDKSKILTRRSNLWNVSLLLPISVVVVDDDDNDDDDIL